MRRWAIIGAADVFDYESIKSRLRDDDFLVSVDAGQRHVEKLGLKADLYIGDFDSSEVPITDVETLTYPIEKDDTDTMLAIKAGLARGCRSFIIFGGMGGRFDHTIANIHALCYADKHNASAALADENNFVFVLRNDSAIIENNKNEKISLFALNGAAHGVTLEGFYYKLNNASLFGHDPVGTSNYLIKPTGKITVKKGTLLVVISKEN